MATRNVEMIYENGMLRPLEQLNLQEGERIRVELGRTWPPTDDNPVLAAIRRELESAEAAPSLEEVHAITAKMSSLSKTIIDEREERCCHTSSLTPAD
ncbi:hypothetical protein F183_A04530 [Bryobacterales bacterium F-183]|nr:hypothetical protein F183_A04530 [Bryobacterales bacterium F-183]